MMKVPKELEKAYAINVVVQACFRACTTEHEALVYCVKLLVEQNALLVAHNGKLLAMQSRVYSLYDERLRSLLQRAVNGTAAWREEAQQLLHKLNSERS